MGRRCDGVADLPPSLPPSLPPFLPKVESKIMPLLNFRAARKSSSAAWVLYLCTFSDALDRHTHSLPPSLLPSFTYLKWSPK